MMPPSLSTPPVPVAEIDHLGVCARAGERRRLVHDLSLRLHAGETLGILGESGSGKTLTLRSLIGALAPRQFALTGSVRVLGQCLLGDDGAANTVLPQLRGRRVAMVYQDPSAALDPMYPVGAQMVEALQAFSPVTAAQARRVVLEALAQVQFNEPERLLGRHAHELSGGQKQRIAIAMALLHRPQILLADEPTTALDLTIQAQVLQMLKRRQQASGMAILLVTHDVSVMAEMADRVLVMDQGQVIEQGDVAQVLTHPRHPKLKAILQARQSLVGRLATSADRAA